MDNNASNNSSNNNLLPNNIVRSYEPSHNTYDSDSGSLIRTTQEIFIRMSGKRGQTQSKQAAQPSSSHNESRTRYASCSIERHNESRNEYRTRHTSRSIERGRSFSPERRRSRSLSRDQ
ncbi:15895_t:CDS:1 [Gigaspora margarita]|uniref:15895_t:CDS:1 n=1 Tax=Gigaspora margarita TaxID=4874 RepID=A0ABN7XF04_GIGMA|nr:15895_t:CDS:1 [Gigaspora margarita]